MSKDLEGMTPAELKAQADAILAAAEEDKKKKASKKAAAEPARVLTDEETKKAVQLLIADRNKDPVSFGNARGVRNIFEQILTAQCNRLAELEELTREDLMKITVADVDAVRALPEKKLI